MYVSESVAPSHLQIQMTIGTIGQAIGRVSHMSSPGSYPSEEVQISRAISKKFTQFAFRQVGTRKPSYMPSGPDPCISRLRPCGSTYVDYRTKETVTCVVSVLLTSKPVDVILRPLHAAKRSRKCKPYRALRQSALSLSLYFSPNPLQLSFYLSYREL